MIISKWMKQRRNWQTGKNQWWIHNLHDCRLEMLQKINTFLTPSFTDKWKQNFFLFNQLNLLQYDRVTKNFFFFFCYKVSVPKYCGVQPQWPQNGGTQSPAEDHKVLWGVFLPAGVRPRSPELWQGTAALLHPAVSKCLSARSCQDTDVQQQ